MTSLPQVVAVRPRLLPVSSESGARGLSRPQALIRCGEDELFVVFPLVVQISVLSVRTYGGALPRGGGDVELAPGEMTMPSLWVEQLIPKCTQKFDFYQKQLI